MTDSRKIQRGALLACFLFFFCRLAARAASLIHSAVAADVLYREGMLPGLLLGIRAVMTWLSVLTVVLACSLLAKRIPEKAMSGMVWGFTLICFADAAGVFLLDLCSGAFRENILIWLGLTVVVGTWLAETAFVWLVYCIARKTSARNKSVLWTSFLHMAWQLVLETIYLVQFLIDVDFSPYPKEIWSILRSYGEIVLWQGMALWLAATMICRLRRSRTSETS